MGESVMLNRGRAGEHLVMADLLLSGLSAFMTDAGMPYDIVVENRGRFIKLQVKSTIRPAFMNREYATPVYLFNARRAGKGGKRLYDITEFDGYALVALDIKQIAYIRFTEKVRKTIILRDRRQKYKVNVGKIAPYVDEFPVMKFLNGFVDPNVVAHEIN